MWQELRQQQEETQRRIDEANAAIEANLQCLLKLEQEKLDRMRAEAATGYDPWPEAPRTVRWKAAPTG